MFGSLSVKFCTAFGLEIPWVLAILGFIGAVELTFPILWWVVAVDLGPGWLSNACLRTCVMARAVLW